VTEGKREREAVAGAHVEAEALGGTDGRRWMVGLTDRRAGGRSGVKFGRLGLAGAARRGAGRGRTGQGKKPTRVPCRARGGFG
jgi:hypothetical protein